ncbi:acetylxylan esterase [Blastopirellula marina]|uniref:Acetylxylan esterase n=1 Tax=Blastopirellula marina TaxID=124 RepID=A0A2S8F758_9BACT|nr:MULTISPECIES: acetylxylan esterase [Pirellulaceae]PQO27978.1 acetylxylan esterase [Blastopirellula marina]RCS48403.1 acetylxylan esterase [Bremerella cremea]
MRRTHVFSMAGTFLVLACSVVSLANAQDAADVLPPGQIPDDARLAPPKDLDGYFPFSPPASLAEWNVRAEEVRTQLKVALGLWPLPPRTPLNYTVVGRHEFEDYAVSNVRLESVPGLFVTGNLYEPVGKEGPFPGVLCPHGHWANGRYYVADQKAVKEQLESGAEADAIAAENPIQARSVHLARMGCVVLQIDMLGYADSQQLSYELVHRFAKQRAEMNTNDRWGFFSPQAESHLQSVMGLQIWNCIRSLDVLEGLSNVDKSRLAVTGASGGATQTMLVSAIDPRLAASFPAVMVSTAMQGGCTCENCSLLRVGTGNVEFAALFAPKPQGLTSANDWTVEFEKKGYPDLKRLYGLLDAEDQVKLTARTEFGHNYNRVSRKAMYELLNNAFDLNASTEERPFNRLGSEELSVWTDENLPSYKPDFERDLLETLTKESDEQIQPLLLGDSDAFDKYRQLVNQALDVVVGWKNPATDQVDFKVVNKQQQEDFLLIAGLLRNDQNKSELPALFLYPNENWNGHTVLWLSQDGKSGVFDAGGRLKSEVAKLVSSGISVAAIDLVYQGEFLSDGQPLSQTPKVKNEREAAAYTLGYNHSVAAERIQDILSMAAFMRSHDRQPKSIGLVALDPTMAALGSVAIATQSNAFDFGVLKTNGFRFGHVNSIRSPDLLPGGAKYGDVPGFLAMAAPTLLRVIGEDDASEKPVQLAYKRAGKPEMLSDQQSDVSPVDWIMNQLSAVVTQ